MYARMYVRTYVRTRYLVPLFFCIFRPSPQAMYALTFLVLPPVPPPGPLLQSPRIVGGENSSSVIWPLFERREMAPTWYTSFYTHFSHLLL